MPLGLYANFVRDGAYITMMGNTSNVLANTDYTVSNCPVMVTFSGGTAVSISIKDSAGNVVQSGLASVTQMFLPRGWKINFGNFTAQPTTRQVYFLS